MIVAMDGPAGTGKGTISKLVAQRMNFMYIDTGAMFRAVTLKMVRNDIKLEEEQRIIDMFFDTKISFESTTKENGEFFQKVFLDGEDVSEEIRTPEISELASPYSTNPIIRENILKLERELAANQDTIMEGRDITTVVFPNAEVKIYLDATPEERANRRFKEYQAKGIECTYEETLQAITERDYRDMHRDVAPLMIVDDATVIDTTELSIEEVFERVKQLIDNKRLVD